ncbi:MAG: hypothetical protein RIR97_264 [Pseudomonadota bacterium]
MSAETLTIARMGAEGDGIADSASGPVFVPFAIPGDVVSVVRIKNQGTVMAVTSPSPDRVAPSCLHFGPDADGGACGGCNLQHMALPAYHAFKRDLVVHALKAKGLTPEIAPLVVAAPHERRRAVFTARKTEKELLLGFHQAGSHHIVSIQDCPVISKGLLARLGSLKTIGRALATSSEPFRMTVLETETGLDLALEGIKGLDDAKRRLGIETILREKGIARVSLNGETLIEPVTPVLRFGSIDVSPPSGGFVQATRQAEQVMVELVLGHLGKAKRVADLFAGSGTFSLQIARIARVHAVESDDKALKALDRAARMSQGLKPVTVEKRDLFRRPLMAQELKTYDAVVFDPPRAGAEFQTQELARSGVRKIVAVSCNPLTLARDLALLTAAGYAIRFVTPIDQFLWSSHVEIVVGLEK